MSLIAVASPRAIRFRRVRSVLATTVLLSGVGRCVWAGPLPTTLTLLPNGPGNSSIVLQNVVYDGAANSGSPVKGHGDLKLIVYGVTAPAQASIPFQNVVADDTGQITGGGIALANDVPVTNLFGSGVDLNVSKGTQITVLTKGLTTKLTGTLSAVLPFRSSSGDRATLSLPTAITLSTSGDFSMDVTGATLTGPTAKDGLTLAGFGIHTTAADIHLAHPGTGGKAFDFNITLPVASVSTPIPNLLTQDNAPLTVVAHNLAIDQDGSVTCSDAQLASVIEVPYRVAGRGLPPPGPSAHVIHLAQPLDFVITVTGAQLGITKNAITKLSITGDLTLPPDLTDSKGDRIEIKGITLAYDAAKDGLTVSVAPGSQAFDCTWNKFTLHINGFKLDLTGPNKGITISQGQLDLPVDLFSSGGGKKASIKVTDFTIDSHGVSGGVEIRPGNLAGIELLGYKLDFRSGTLQFSRNQLVAGALVGVVTVPEWNNGQITLNVGISSAGGLLSADVDTSHGLTVSKFGMSVTLTAGSLQVAKTGKASLMLTGSLSFPGIQALGSSAIAFKDLGVNSDGSFELAGGWLTLPHPANLDLGVMSVNCTQLGFGKDARGEWFGLTGGVKLSDDLPVTGEIDFDGLKVYANNLTVVVGGLHVKAAIDGVGSLEGRLEHPTDPNDPAVKQFGDCLFGSATLQLDVLGGAGIDLMFFTGNNAWFVGGGIVLPAGIPLPIPPPPTGPLMAIYGFHGGIGHGVNIKPGTGQVGDIKDFVAAKGNWLAQAGLLLGSYPDLGHVWWGDLTLTLGLPDFSIDLNGKATFVSLEGPGNHDSAWWEGQDRWGEADISYVAASKTFRASVDAHLSFPTKSHAILQADGGLELLISPDEGHLWIGWPRDTHPISVSMLGTSVSGGIGIGMWKPIYIRAGIHYGADFGIVKGYIDGEVDLDFAPNFLLKGKIEADGEVDFKVISLSAHAEADASYDGSKLALGAEFEACVGCFLGHVCFDTGHVNITIP